MLARMACKFVADSLPLAKMRPDKQQIEHDDDDHADGHHNAAFLRSQIELIQEIIHCQPP